MRAAPDDDLYAYESLRITAGNGDKEAMFFARYRAWGYLIAGALIALAVAAIIGAGPVGYLVLQIWAGLVVLLALQVLDHNRGLLDVLVAAAADFASWLQRPRPDRPLTLTPRRNR